MPTYGKNNFKESNVNYLNKDFVTLKQSLMEYAKSYFPNSYRDFNETSPGMMLIEMNAYVGDVLSFYIDQQYKEMMLPLAEERRNIITMAKMFGYKVKPIVPSYVTLTFTQNLNAAPSDTSKIDYSTGGQFDMGIEVKGTDSGVIFSTLEPVDFKISSSADTNNVNAFDTVTGLASDYAVTRDVVAVSGKEKTATFKIGTPEKFKKITISDLNVIDIISCVDSNGNNWYEVDFLAQDKVPIETHYTSDISRQSAYQNQGGLTATTAVPYSLEYIKTTKRFTRETNSDNTTSLIFGNGVLKDGNVVDESFVDLEQVGIVVPGQANDLNQSINPLLGDEYSTLGETPNQTTLTVKYRVGGGVDSNVPSADLTIIQSGDKMPGSTVNLSELTVTNNSPARGGKDEETIDEIREKTRAFFSTQNRCVTKEDYEARILNVPSKFGNIAKVYVTRSGDIDTGANNNTAVQGYLDTLQSLNDNIRMSRESVDNLKTYIVNNAEAGGVGTDGFILFRAGELLSMTNNIDRNINTLSEPVGELDAYSDLTVFDMSTIKAYVLSYDDNKNLVGNPAVSYLTGTNSVSPQLLANIKNYLSNFRILTDNVELMDGYIINFGVFFDVIAEKYANKQQVKLRCIDKIKEYFHIDKMQFNQPIFKSQLEYELMGVEGVRSIGHVTITQEEDYFYSDPTADETLSIPTYTYAYSGETDQFENLGSDNYNYLYNFQGALTEDGIILPPGISTNLGIETPTVFELKNPNENIQGRVR